MDSLINGGAQFRRLQYETEVYFRLVEICTDVTKKDVVQSRGVTLGTLTWGDATVKILRQKAPIKAERHCRYVAERIRWFYMQQKSVIANFMITVKNTSEARLFSTLYEQRGRILAENENVRQVIFNRYDAVLERQRKEFLDHLIDTIHSMLQNPRALLKASSMPLLTDNSLDDVCLPSFEDTKERIPEELQLRAAIENYLKNEIDSIPDEEFMIDEAIEKVSMLCFKTFSFVRSMIADQMELFCISFYQLPMFRRLEEDMMDISEAEINFDTQRGHIEEMTKEHARVAEGLENIRWCQESITQCCLLAEQVPVDFSPHNFNPGC